MFVDTSPQQAEIFIEFELEATISLCNGRHVFLTMARMQME